MLVPAGMDDPALWEFQTNRQRSEPLNGPLRFLFRGCHLIQKSLMLMLVLPRMQAQMLAGMIWIRRVIEYGIEFMITKDAVRAADLDHTPDDPYHFQVLWPPVDQVADEYRLLLVCRMAKNRLIFGAVVFIPQLGQQAAQFVYMAVDIANNIQTGLVCVAHFHGLFSSTA
jgi:hypothetical protein